MQIELPARSLVHVSATVMACLISLAWCDTIWSRGYVPTQTDELAAASRWDPPLNSLSGFGEILADKTGTIVCVLSDCSDCSRTRLALFSKAANKTTIACTVVVLSSEEVRLPSPQDVPVHQAEPSFQGKWNVVFQPRIYAVSFDGKFLYIQPHDVPFELAIEQAIEALR